MKEIRKLLFLTACTLLAPPLHAQQSQTEQMFGKWKCPLTYTKDSVTIAAESEDSYIRNGRFNSFGLMAVTFGAGGPTINYSISVTGSWKVIDGYLIQEYGDFKVINLTDPKIDKIFNLKDMLPSGMSDSSKIVQLTEKSITLKSESEGIQYICDRLLSSSP